MRITLRAVLVVAWVVAVVLLLAAAVWPWLDEPDPRTWPRIPWPDVGGEPAPPSRR